MPSPRNAVECYRINTVYQAIPGSFKLNHLLRIFLGTITSFADRVRSYKLYRFPPTVSELRNEPKGDLLIALITKVAERVRAFFVIPNKVRSRKLYHIEIIKT